MSDPEGAMFGKGGVLGELDKMVIFEEKVLKEISYLFKQRYIFEKKV